MHQSLRAIRIEKQNAEDSFKSISVELEQLQVQIVDLQNQKEGLESNLVSLKQVKLQLEEKLHNLQTKIQEVEKKTGLHQLSSSSYEQHTIEINIDPLQMQLNQLKIQILEQQNIKDDLEKELNILTQKNLH